MVTYSKMPSPNNMYVHLPANMADGRVAAGVIGRQLLFFLDGAHVKIKSYNLTVMGGYSLRGHRAHLEVVVGRQKHDNCLIRGSPSPQII